MINLVKRTRKRAIYAARNNGSKYRTSGIHFDDEFETNVKLKPHKNSIKNKEKKEK